MNKQPEALRLADAIDFGKNRSVIDCIDAASELRQLHEVNTELLEALKEIASVKFSNWSDGEMRQIASAAIAKATGEQA